MHAILDLSEPYTRQGVAKDTYNHPAPLRIMYLHKCIPIERTQTPCDVANPDFSLLKQCSQGGGVTFPPPPDCTSKSWPKTLLGNMFNSKSVQFYSKSHILISQQLSRSLGTPLWDITKSVQSGGGKSSPPPDCTLPVWEICGPDDARR